MPEVGLLDHPKSEGALSVECFSCWTCSVSINSLCQPLKTSEGKTAHAASPVHLYWVNRSSENRESDRWRYRWGGGQIMGESAGQCEHQHPPWWCWSQPVCPGDGWAVWEGDSSSSARGGLVLSWPTGGGHGRSLITLISTACAARGEVEGKRWRGKKMEGK